MAWCEIYPEGTGQGNAHEPFGATADKRKMWLHFSFAADPGGDAVLSDAEIDAAMDETSSVEVCSIQAPLIGTSPPVIRCPWSEGEPGGQEWLVYSSAWSDPPNEARDSLVEPVASQIEPWGATTARHGSYVPADWLSLQNHGLILFFRTRTADDPNLVPPYWGSYGVEGIVGSIVTGGDGFCAVPTPLPSWTSWVDPGTNEIWFRALGIPLDRFEDNQGGLYRNPFYWFGLDPCTEGSAAPGAIIPGVSPCIDPRMAEWTTARLASFEDWQRRYLQGVTVYAEPTWQWGSGGDCVGTCPTNVVFQQHPANMGGFYGAARLSFPPVNEWTEPWGADQRALHFGVPLSVVAHEYQHQLVDNGWRREHGLDLHIPPGKHPTVPPLFHEDNNTFAKTVCLEDYPGLGQFDPCVSATRIWQGGGLSPWEANNYLADPRQPHLHEPELSWLFLRYAMEQFSVPIAWGTPAHPDGEDSAGDLQWKYQLPLGHADRRTDEGVDLLGHILDGYLHPDNQNKPAPQATGFGLEQALHRSFRSLMLDFHTAIALKDYSDPPSYQFDPRWRLEWVGSFTVGGPNVFPDNPPAALTIAQAKTGNGGRLPHVTDALAISPDDDLRQALRLRDDWDYGNMVEVVLNQGDPPLGGSGSVAPYGAAILSSYVDRSDPIWWHMRVRIDSESVPPPRVRIFTIDASGVPHVWEGCEEKQPLGCTAESDPDCTEVCPWTSFLDGDGKIVRTVEQALPVRRLANYKDDIDEVLVVVSGGKEGADFSWSMGDIGPSVQIIEPTTSHPAEIGHALLPAFAVGARPFLLKFRTLNENNEPLAVLPSDVELEIPGCTTLNPNTDYQLHRFDPAEFWAVVNVPAGCYPPADEDGYLGIGVRVLLGSVSATESSALHYSINPPRVAMQLVVDTSDSMTPWKLYPATAAGRLLIASLADDDAVGVVTFEDDARVARTLMSNCTPGARQEAISTLVGLSSWCGGWWGGTSIGDGLFEAQAIFAWSFDAPSGWPATYWGTEVPDCRPTAHAMVVLTDGINNEPWQPAMYYGYGSPVSMDPHDGQPDTPVPPWPPVCLGDDFFVQGGWLRYHDRVAHNLRVPTISAVAFGHEGEDAYLAELQKLLWHTNGGNVHYVDWADDNSYHTRMRATVEMSDRFRQGGNAASGHERAAAWHAQSILPDDMPPMEIEPYTRELLVSVSSARDDTTLLQLMSPSGDIVAPAEAHPVATVFRVSDPEPGMWVWQLSRPLPPPSPQDPPAVFVEQAVRGPVQFHASADVTLLRPVPPGGGPYEDGRLAGSEISIRALPTAGGPILDALVVAEVTTPAGIEKVVILRDDGLHGDGAPNDGVYGARFSDTLDAGIYPMRIYAKGISPVSGAPFTREKSLALFLHDGEDEDEDELPDWWEVKTAGVLVTLATTSDADEDGLPDLREYELDLSPLRADTDGGGEADGSEVLAGRDPLDPADDQADVFEPSVAPGNGKALVDLRVPFLLEATAELQRATTPEGPWSYVFTGAPPRDGIVADEAANEVQACYRMRTSIARVTSDWSVPICVLPRPDPLPPRLSLRLDRARLGGSFVTARDGEITVLLDASDAPPRIFGSEVRGAYVLGDGAGYELLDAEVMESGLSEMMVSLRGTFEDAAWQPFEPEVSLAVPGGDYFVVYVKVRDGAGNESRPAALPVRIEDDWPAGHALVGLRSLLVEHGSSVTGDVAVIEASAEEDAWELVVAHGSIVQGSARADSVVLLHDADVSGSVYSNTLSSNGFVAGEHVTPIGVPVHLRLPRMPDIEPGEVAVTVGEGEVRELGPGSYGEIVLAGGSSMDPTVLVLSGGTYQLASLRAGKHARIECAAPCEIRVEGELWIDKDGYLGPTWDDLQARDVGIYVAGGAGSDEDAVRIGNDGRVRARIFAPAGRLRLGHGVAAAGAFVAAHLRVGHGVEVGGSP